MAYNANTGEATLNGHTYRMDRVGYIRHYRTILDLVTNGASIANPVNRMTLIGAVRNIYRLQDDRKAFHIGRMMILELRAEYA